MSLPILCLSSSNLHLLQCCRTSLLIVIDVHLSGSLMPKPSAFTEACISAWLEESVDCIYPSSRCWLLIREDSKTSKNYLMLNNRIILLKFTKSLEKQNHKMLLYEPSR